jgi:Na+/H+-dicarboxylate symporter
MKTIRVKGMILIPGVDWFLAEARAMTNLIGNGVATIIMARWENEFDDSRANAVLNGDLPDPPELTDERNGELHAPPQSECVEETRR